MKSRKRPTRARSSGARPARRPGTKRAAPRRADALMPVKLSGTGTGPDQPEKGPLGWFLPLIESTYTRLEPRGVPARAVRASSAVPASGVAFSSRLQPAAGEAALAEPPRTLWLDRLAEYKGRKAAAARARAARALAAPAPAIPGARNWLPLGPTVVLEGQTVGEQPVGGRVCGLAVTPEGQILYAASACGGVFRSDDGGTSWRSLMDGFDLDPTNFASASLACGAIALDPGNPDRVYVGTGEGDTHQLFLNRVVNALPAYRGVGPIRTDDGGKAWESEATAAGSPPLAGEAFFALAVDPGNGAHVVAATTAGLYQRVPRADGTPEWIRRRPGVHSSVVVAAAGGVSRFFAAEWGSGVLESTDGQSWTPLGTGFPATDVGRVALAVQAANPGVLYALVAREASGGLHGVYRLDAGDGTWKSIASPPDVLPLVRGRSQGAYDLAIAIDPNRVDR